MRARAPSVATTARTGELLGLRAAQAPGQTYVESASGERVLTYDQLLCSTLAWARLLGDLGAAPGETVGLSIADPVDFAGAFVGVLASGRIAAPLDPGATEAEVAAVCERIAPRLVVADRAGPGEWVAMGPGAFALVGAGDGGPEGHEEGRDLGELGGGGGLVLSTSGTTGTPKVIALDEQCLLHTARAVAAHHELSPSDRGFNPLPLFHVNAEVVGLLATLVAGATVVLDDRFHRRGFWATIASRRITWINAVPAILARLAVLEDGEAVPGGVRFARSASAPLPAAVLERFEGATGIPVLETYGMTEAASQITANPLRGPRKVGSVGLPVATELRVVATGREEPGRVEIRGPSVIRAYARPGYEDRFDREGWLDTGDLGFVDEDGYLYLVGRADDVINRGGEKIHPREVEEVILAEAGVAAVAVVGWDHEVLGRVPVAYLVANGVRGPTDRAAAADLVARLQARCAAALSRAKRPAAFHVVERLPQGATGKVRRRAVAEGTAIYSLLVR